MPRDDGLRSLRCCKRRSIVSNLRGFGHKWSSSRQRIAILHLTPIRSDPFTTYSKTSSTSELALAAATGLSLQGHSVTLYTPGYRHKDIPDHLWDSSADIKSCLPRIVRLALFSSGSGSSQHVPSAFVQAFVALILSIRVIFHCIISFLTNLMWSLLPQVIQRARGGRTAVTTSIGTSMKLLDVLITFESSSAAVSIPHILLSPFAKKVISISPDYHADTDDSFTWFSTCREPDLSIVTSDSDCLMNPHRSLTTIYPPVVGIETPSLPDKNRPYFVALSWYKKNFSDLFIAIESFAVFLKSFSDQFSENEEDGCTGSLSMTTTAAADAHSQSTKPFLMVVDVRPEDYLIVLREITRLRLRLDQDIVVCQSMFNSRETAKILDGCIGVIHTPTEVNEVRIPCAGMLSSRPVVTTMSFCLSEPVRHESTGVLVKTASPHLVAQGIEHVYSLYTSRPTEWTRMGQRGKQRVVTEFSIEMFGSRLDDVIESSGCNRILSGNSLRPRAYSASSAAGSDRGGRTLSVQSGLSELVAATSTTD